MSTYDGAYANQPVTRYPGGWNDICTCDDDDVNPFCNFHGEIGKQRVREYEESMRLLRSELGRGRR